MVFIRVRDPGLLALSLLLLAGSGGLGLLVHDGAVGLDVQAALTADDGDWLRLKGDLAAADRIPDEAREALLAHTVRLQGTGLDATVYVTSPEPLPEAGTMVVTGRLLLRLEAPDVLVLEAEQMNDPIFFQ